MTISEVSQEMVPVVFFTKSSAFVVSERPILVPVTSTPAELSDLVRHLIISGGDDDLPASVSFNFLFESVADVHTLLRGELKKMLLEAGWTLERTVRLEYFEASPEPQLVATIEHPEWINTVVSNGSSFATGCYDGSIRTFARDNNKPLCVVNNHSMAVSGVAFIPSKSGNRLVSVSQDKSAFALHQTDSSSTLEKSFKFSSSADLNEPFSCVAANRRGDFIAVGSISGKIAVYSGKREEQDDIIVAAEPAKKKSRKSASAVTVPETKQRRPRFVLDGAHSATVTALLFDSNSMLFSGSLDGSIRAWDLNEQTFAFILSCDSPITALAINSVNPKLLISGHPDGSVRLWDISEPLISSSALQPSTFFAGNPQVMKKRMTGLHKGWITALAWSPRNENAFASTGHDGAVHIWDIRSDPTAPAPQYTLKSGNSLKDDQENVKILALDWAADGLIRYGGEDCKLSIFSTK